MRLDNKHLLSWLLHRKLKAVLKSKGLSERDFEILVMVKFIEDRIGRACYVKDLKTMLPGMSWNSYGFIYNLSSAGLVNFIRSKRKWAGQPRMEIRLTGAGSEFIEIMRMKSESEIACIKHQLDSERSIVNRTSKKIVKRSIG